MVNILVYPFFLKFAELIYKDDNSLKSFVKNKFWHKEFYIDGPNVIDDIKFSLTKYEDFQVLAIRGSRSFENWLINADILTSVEGIHSGFNRAAKIVLRYVSEYLDINKRLFLTGHSLGGAIATVVAYYLDRKYNNIGFVYTFGSPRCGNRRLARDTKKTGLYNRCLRFVRDYDLVSSMPKYLLGYRHVGDLIWIRDKEIIPNPSRYQIFMCIMKDIFNKPFKLILLSKIKYHSVASYFLKEYTINTNSKNADRIKKLSLLPNSK